jgi:hypothetical protein
MQKYHRIATVGAAPHRSAKSVATTSNAYTGKSGGTVKGGRALLSGVDRPDGSDGADRPDGSDVFPPATL